MASPLRINTLNEGDPGTTSVKFYLEVKRCPTYQTA